MKRVPLLILLIATFVALSPPASATFLTLSDGNSSVAVSPDTQAGMYNWTINGVNILYQQWFWYRVDNSGPEYSLDHLGAPTVTATADTLRLLYGDPTNFQIEVRYSLVGGQPGSSTADISEQIRINNHASSPLDMHFFQYSDFDLNRAAGHSDTLKISPTLQIATQLPAPGGSSTVLSETTLGPQPTYAEANTGTNTLNALNDAFPTTLNGNLSITTPSDVTWAFEWDAMLGSGETLLISKDKRLAAVPVPEPAACVLVGGALLALSTKLRKRYA